MKRQVGFSIVELMVAITLGIVLMTGVVQMFVSSKSVFTTQQGLSRLQETGRLAVDYLARDIRQAGYFGCADVTAWNLKNSLNNTNMYGSNFSLENSLRVYADNALPAGLVLDPAPVDDTPVLIVQTANERSVSVSRVNTANQVFVDLTTPPGEDCPSGICENDIVVAADCDKAIIFQATGLAEMAGEVAISHAAGADPGNARTVWGGGDARQDTIDVGAEVFSLNNVVYYIAEDGDGALGLYQKVQNNPAFQLLRGVENINYTVGITNDDDPQADVFLDYDAGVDWGNAVAIRMDVLVQTPDDNATVDKQTYDFAGEEVTADDNRIRQVFSTTVGARPRLP
ncbi:PilW family protein [Gilvimarinus agarilyticus]|uniref:PilW family protein n=1 Tax=Gilvimarinus sp. 2_MG-2023 TaxID=3062666 RepID=UPI001C07FB5D|nr:PilW family protein [Gilvimarinus sp. 2_MG-2023]MBU2885209.1 PilW family protein [Gilvimarinus agarilyticus]MDO6570106.1 PilW family protein [Gilvimarinus sp. 2_MG-2023]